MTFQELMEIVAEDGAEHDCIIDWVTSTKDGVNVHFIYLKDSDGEATIYKVFDEDLVYRLRAIEKEILVDVFWQYLNEDYVVGRD